MDNSSRHTDHQALRSVGDCALDIRAHLRELALRRVDARDAHSRGQLDGQQLECLEAELASFRELYMGYAATEIATLRGELFGRQQG